MSTAQLYIKLSKDKLAKSFMLEVMYHQDSDIYLFIYVKIMY